MKRQLGDQHPGIPAYLKLMDATNSIFSNYLNRYIAYLKRSFTCAGKLNPVL
jgi:hypothetical protein